MILDEPGCTKKASTPKVQEIKKDVVDKCIAHKIPNAEPVTLKKTKQTKRAAPAKGSYAVTRTRK